MKSLPVPTIYYPDLKNYDPKHRTTTPRAGRIGDSHRDPGAGGVVVDGAAIDRAVAIITQRNQLCHRAGATGGDRFYAYDY